MSDSSTDKVRLENKIAETLNSLWEKFHGGSPFERKNDKESSLEQPVHLEGFHDLIEDFGTQNYDWDHQGTNGVISTDNIPGYYIRLFFNEEAGEVNVKVIKGNSLDIDQLDETLKNTKGEKVETDKTFKTLRDTEAFVEDTFETLLSKKQRLKELVWSILENGWNDDEGRWYTVEDVDDDVDYDVDSLNGDVTLEYFSCTPDSFLIEGDFEGTPVKVEFDSSESRGTVKASWGEETQSKNLKSEKNIVSFVKNFIESHI